jgi:hypothetical protein
MALVWLSASEKEVTQRESAKIAIDKDFIVLVRYLFWFVKHNTEKLTGITVCWWNVVMSDVYVTTRFLPHHDD